MYVNGFKGMEAILYIRRLQRSFHGAHGSSAPNPTLNTKLENTQLKQKVGELVGQEKEGKSKRL